jgi:hypothetical protein
MPPGRLGGQQKLPAAAFCTTSLGRGALIALGMNTPNTRAKGQNSMFSTADEIRAHRIDRAVRRPESEPRTVAAAASCAPPGGNHQGRPCQLAERPASHLITFAASTALAACPPGPRAPGPSLVGMPRARPAATGHNPLSHPAALCCWLLLALGPTAGSARRKARRSSTKVQQFAFRVPRVSAAELAADEALLSGTRPFILTGEASQWPAATLWQGADPSASSALNHLVRVIPEETVDYYSTSYDHTMDKVTCSPHAPNS